MKEVKPKENASFDSSEMSVRACAYLSPIKSSEDEGDRSGRTVALWETSGQLF